MHLDRQERDPAKVTQTIYKKAQIVGDQGDDHKYLCKICGCIPQEPVECETCGALACRNCPEEAFCQCHSSKHGRKRWTSVKPGGPNRGLSHLEICCRYGTCSGPPFTFLKYEALAAHIVREHTGMHLRKDGR